MTNEIIMTVQDDKKWDDIILSNIDSFDRVKQFKIQECLAFEDIAIKQEFIEPCYDSH